MNINSLPQERYENLLAIQQITIENNEKLKSLTGNLLKEKINKDLIELSDAEKKISNTTLEIVKNRLLDFFNDDNKSASRNMQREIMKFNEELFEDESDALQVNKLNREQQVVYNTSLNKVKQQNKLTMRLKSKQLVKQTAEFSKRLKENLMLGIENIKFKMSFKESEQKANSLLDYKTKKADAMMEKFLHEEELSKNLEAQPKKKKSKNKGKNLSLKKIEVKNKDAITITPLLKKVSGPTLEEKLAKFALNLLNRSSFKYVEHSRVRRWETVSPEEIRHFVDKDNRQHYRYLTNEEILEQRARHFLPGTERLIREDAYRAIYAFPTDRGEGLVAQLSYKNKTHNGILYLGIDKTHLIFHKYFEEIDFTDLEKDVFRDAQAVVMETTEKDKEEEWSSRDNFSLDISEEGVVHFNYADHEIHVYPLRKDLFEQELAKVK